MIGYLLDNNHVEAFCRKDPRILKTERTKPAEHLIWVCTITLGEIEAGCLMTQTTNQAKRGEYIKFVHDRFFEYILPVSESTREHYAEIMGKIWQNHSPSSSSKRTEHHLVEQGLDLNDVWAVSVAWEHGLIFLTEDKMEWIREAVGNNVLFENWLQ